MASDISRVDVNIFHIFEAQANASPRLTLHEVSEHAFSNADSSQLAFNGIQQAESSFSTV